MDSVYPLLRSFVGVPSTGDSIAASDSAQLMQSLQLIKLQSLRHEYRQRRLVRRQRESKSWTHWLDQRFHYMPLYLILKKYAQRKKNAYILFVFDLLVDILICIMAIVQISLCENIDDYSYLLYRPLWLWIAILSLSSFNFLSLFVRVGFATNRQNEIFNWLTFIDLLTTFPTLITSALVNGRFFAVPIFLRSIVAVDRLSALLYMRLDISHAGTAYDQLTVKLLLLVAAMSAFLFSGMCAFQMSELLFAQRKYSFIDSFYYIVITFSTVGYGDITPHAWFSRFIIAIMIIIALAYFPRSINDIIETYKTRQDGYLSYVISSGIPFVVVNLSYRRDRFFEDILETCHYTLIKRKGKTSSSLAKEEISNDLFGEFQEMNKLLNTSYHIVFLASSPPSVYVKNLLKTRKYEKRVTLIYGSALEENDLKRSGITSAAACFVVADRSKVLSGEEAVEEDHSNVLRVWSIRRYAPETPVFVYNLRPETELHVKPVCRQVVCITTLKQMILGHSAIFRGSATLITNLIHQAPKLRRYTSSWQVAYSDGLNNRIIFGPFNPIFEDKIFSELVWYLYAEFQVILIGLHCKVPARVTAQEETPLFTYKDHYVLNPGKNYRVPSKNLVHRLIFIAHSPDDIADVCCLTMDQFRKTWAKWHAIDQTLNQHIRIPVNTLFEARQRKERSVASQSSQLSSPEEPILIRSPFLPANESKNVRMKIGNPIPPHHMTIDRDLQTPFCHLLITNEKLENVILDDVTDGAVDPDSSNDHLSSNNNIPEEKSKGKKKRGKILRLESHIIVCAANFELWTLLCTLRGSFLATNELKPVVILCANLPSTEEWRSLSLFPFVYCMQGNPLKRKDMLRAGLKNSSAVVMMKHNQSSRLRLQSDERMLDSTAIMATHQIDFMYGSKYVISELVTKNNIKFMRAKSEMLDRLPQLEMSIKEGLSPLDISHEYSSGRIKNEIKSISSNSSIMITEEDENDFLPSFSQPSLVQNKEKKKTSQYNYNKYRKVNTADPGFYAHSAVYASGRVLAGDMFDGIVFESFKTEGIFEVIKLLCGRRYPHWNEVNDHLQMPSSVLVSIPVPFEYVGMSFSALVKYCAIGLGSVPIAIYRRRSIHNLNHISGSLASPPSNLNESANQLSVGRSARLEVPTALGVPFHRARTGGGTLSSRHLFNLETKLMDEDSNGNPRRNNDYEMQVKDLTVTSMQGRDAYEHLNKLLQDSNKIDNDLPFVITNPLPDFMLDELDYVFLLQMRQLQ